MSSAPEIRSGETPDRLYASNPPSKLRTYGFAIAIIIGLAVGSVGAAGCFGAISSLNQVPALIMMGVGGVTILSIVYRCCKKKNEQEISTSPVPPTRNPSTPPSRPKAPSYAPPAPPQERRPAPPARQSASSDASKVVNKSLERCCKTLDRNRKALLKAHEFDKPRALQTIAALLHGAVGTIDSLKKSQNAQLQILNKKSSEVQVDPEVQARYNESKTELVNLARDALNDLKEAEADPEQVQESEESLSKLENLDLI